MAHKFAGFIMIRKLDLPQTPQAFQSYVRDYFMEIDSKGEIFLVAITTSSGIRRSGHNSRPVDKGVAPLGGGLAKYDKMGDGLPEGMGLDDWIHAERRKGGESPIMSFYVSWDDGCIESVVGDD